MVAHGGPCLCVQRVRWPPPRQNNCAALLLAVPTLPIEGATLVMSNRLVPVARFMSDGHEAETMEQANFCTSSNCRIIVLKGNSKLSDGHEAETM